LGYPLGMWKRLAVLAGVLSVFFIEGLWLFVAILVRSVVTGLTSLAVIVLTIWLFYTRLYEKREVRYPLVPPEGKTDIYFPRTDIPRPVYADFRSIEERKEKLEKVKKKVKRKGK